jgi:hypothetical protein
MDYRHEKGLFLTLEDCKAVFSRLKKTEGALSASEREVFLKLEKTLYANLSIQEAENLLYGHVRGS